MQLQNSNQPEGSLSPKPVHVSYGDKQLQCSSQLVPIIQTDVIYVIFQGTKIICNKC